jgi:aldose 1-epimerase
MDLVRRRAVGQVQRHQRLEAGAGRLVTRGLAQRGEDPVAVADGLPDGPSVPLPPELDFSKSRPLGDLRLDACFGGFDGRAQIGWPESGVRLFMECSPNVTHLICFAPADRPLVAVEPVANASDGVNLLATGAEHSGVIPLPAGKTLEASFTIRAAVD